MYCKNCGSEIADKAVICVNCGVATAQANSGDKNCNCESEGISPKSGVVALLLCIFLGTIGVHRFFVGKVGTGILMILTFGGFGIWVLIDLIMIVMSKFTDSKGLIVKL